MELDIELRIKETIKRIGYEKIQEDSISATDILKIVSVEAQDVGAQISVKWIKENYDYKEIINKELDKLKKQQQKQQHTKKRPMIKKVRYSPRSSANKSFASTGFLNKSKSLADEEDSDEFEDFEDFEDDERDENDFSSDSDDEPISNLFRRG